MKHPIDLEHWNRKEHFLFFGSMDDPFFGLTTQIDVTSIYKEAKADHASFFLYSLHKIMTAVNEVEEFRYRIIDNIPVCFDRIHVGTTIGREDGTFGFGFFEYTPDRQLFLQNAQKEIERVQALTGLCKDRESDRQDLVRFSPVPWIAFTEMKHASSFRTGDSAYPHLHRKADRTERASNAPYLRNGSSWLDGRQTCVYPLRSYSG